MKYRLIKLSFLICLWLSCPTQARTQGDWQKVAPVGESFTVLMPTKAVEASRLIPLNEKDSVPERVYYSVSDGRRYMIVSFVRTPQDQVRPLSSFTDFISAMELSFKGSNGEKRLLIFDSDLVHESRRVKQYRLMLGDYKGLARFTETEKAFFAQIVVGADETDEDVRQFLSSFKVGSTNTDAKATGIISTQDLRGIPSSGSGSAELPPEPWPRTTGPIIGGVLNGKALSLARPSYPKAARKNHDEGLVRVRIVIDEFGKVISAEAIEGPESLREAAIDAAYQSRFSPTRLMGQPVKVSGVIIYNFIAQ